MPLDEREPIRVGAWPEKPFELMSRLPDDFSLLGPAQVFLNEVRGVGDCPEVQAAVGRRETDALADEQAQARGDEHNLD